MHEWTSMAGMQVQRVAQKRRAHVDALSAARVARSLNHAAARPNHGANLLNCDLHRQHGGSDVTTPRLTVPADQVI